jgi:hypothetical protein
MAGHTSVSLKFSNIRKAEPLYRYKPGGTNDHENGAHCQCLAKI